jgi:murein DD-endopeptidase MepM/ murein hydrolase activator NlpD
VSRLIGRGISPEDQANIYEIYSRVTSGNFSPDNSISMSGGTNSTHNIIKTLTENDTSELQNIGFTSPISADWHSLVTCEFGTGYAGHTGMDIGLAERTPIKVVADGTVLYTRASMSGYGNHVVVNHGGGVVTLYAHLSKLLVGEGQNLRQGDVIGLSGNTGNSTGPHLHIEFMINGVPQNPRNYFD